MVFHFRCGVCQRRRIRERRRRRARRRGGPPPGERRHDEQDDGPSRADGEAQHGAKAAQGI